MPSDTLSKVLGSVRLSGGMFFRVQLRAPYAVGTMGAEGIITTYAPGSRRLLPFHLVTKGPMWFEVEGSEPVCLNDGDVIVLPRGAPHVLSDEPGRRPIAIADIDHAVSGTPPLLQWGGEGEVASALCGFFRFDDRIFNPLVQGLPDVLVVRGDAAQSPWLAATLERTFDETLAQRPGGEALIERLTELLFIDVIQRHAEQDHAEGWLAALSDPIIGRALDLLHADHERHWTVEELASEVGASRSMFVQRFTERVGQPPMRYLTAWRMEVAAQELLRSRDPVAQIALAVGYDSESAFNRAFRREIGEPPAAWRRRMLLTARPTTASADASPAV